MAAYSSSVTPLPRLYSHLHSGQIRLLHLQHGSPGDNIRCTLKLARIPSVQTTTLGSLSDPGTAVAEMASTSYDALSYMWGPEVTERDIEINGQSYPIRENLYQALLHLRLPSLTRVLWVDALCINQNDLKERNKQVSQMGRIYLSAGHVIVWLGLPDFSTAEAFNFFEYSSMAHLLASNSSSSGEYLSTLNSIKTFCFREYWKRVWIVQEIVLGAHIEIHCGLESLSWKPLAAFFKQLRELSGKEWLLPPTSELDRERKDLIRALKTCSLANITYDHDRMLETREVDTNSDAWDNHACRPLLHLCAQYGQSHCMDPRDKIFGHHGSSRNCCQGEIKIDYNLSFAQICWMLLSHHSQYHGDSGTAIFADLRLFYLRLEISPNDSRFKKKPHRHVNIKVYYDRQTKSASYSWEIREYYGTFMTKRLVGPDTQYLSLPTKAETSSGSRPIRAVGCVRGRIVSFTAPVDQMSTRSSEIQEIMTAPFKIQLAYLKRVSSTAHGARLPITKQLDLVFQINGSARHTISRKISKALGNNVEMGLPKKFENSSLLKVSHLYPKNETDNISLNDMLTMPEGTTNIKFAFEENGLILFVPLNAEVGDIVCQFKYTDSLVLVRQDPENKDECIIVGRIVNYLATSPTTACDNFSVQPTFWGSCSPYQVEFNLDLSMTKLLTMASATPDDLSSVPAPVTKYDPSSPGVHICD